jgi:sugar fermentation stimulation protein A
MRDRTSVDIDAAFYRRGEGPLVAARFVSRENRFVLRARVGGRVVRVASRDPGRLRELLVPGARLRLVPAPPGSARRTRYTLALVRHAGVWISLVPALANDVLAAAVARRGAAGLRGCRVVRREVVRGRSRFDLLLCDRRGERLVEVKSATLVENRVALFPDAPTLRGARHLRELVAHVRDGGRASVVFVVQREDADELRPHAENDPAFAAALRAAAAAGVSLHAYACRVTPRGVGLARQVPVRLGPPASLVTFAP